MQSLFYMILTFLNPIFLLIGMIKSDRFKLKRIQVLLIFIGVTIISLVGYSLTAPKIELNYINWDFDKNKRISNDPESFLDSLIESKEENDKVSDKVNEADKKATPYSMELSAGIYTAGIDFPPGTYTVKTVSGTGYVLSGSADNSSGIDEKLSDSPDTEQIKELENINLKKDGDRLRVTGNLVVNIESSYYDDVNLKPRNNSTAKRIVLGPGYHSSEKDFEPGIYDIKLVEGVGYVHSKGLDDINSIEEYFGPDGIQEFKNVDLYSTTSLDINYITIELVPSE